MRFALLGAGGKSGRAVIEEALSQGHTISALTRAPGQLAARSGLNITVGDARQEESLRATISGCEAIISVLGPTKGVALDFNATSTATLIAAMKAERVARLVIVTGAMCGEPEHLGPFYRVLSSVPSIRAIVQDRKLEEKILRESGLSVTIFRPPRLTESAASPKGATISPSMKIRMLDSCSRIDLARALVAAAAQQPSAPEIFFIRS